eukprot:scaffold20316_cov66-Phaeocystis_antarctica.AAC.9
MVSDSRVRAAALPPPSAPRAVQASHEPCRGRQAAEEPRSGDQLDHVAPVRTRGGIPWAAGPANRVVQQPSKIPHAREQCAGMARENRACYTRLEDRPLGVWVEEGLKEEIAGGRGPRRSSQRPHDEKFWESSIDSSMHFTVSNGEQFALLDEARARPSERAAGALCE